MSEEKFF